MQPTLQINERAPRAVGLLKKLKAPFPYFGGKSRIAHVVWSALGQPRHYLEPFFGSGAVLLNRPDYHPGEHVETICDADPHIANVWRALQAAPEAVAPWCDWPVNHIDLMARKRWLIRNSERLAAALIDDPKYYDAQAAGYWIWAASCWIGSGLTNLGARPHIGHAGKGVHMGTRPHIGDAGQGVHAGKRPQLSRNQGIIQKSNGSILDWFRALQARLRNVRVVHGDWTRITGGNWQTNLGTCGLFLDPPYGVKADRDPSLYTVDSLDVADQVADWALARGDDPAYRIVLAGYYEEHERLLAHGWRVHLWKAQGGYANVGKGRGRENAKREALFMSPHCLAIEKQSQLCLS